MPLPKNTKAILQLPLGKVLDYERNPYLELYCNSVFRDDFFLKMTWQGERVLWQKTSALKYTSSPIWEKWKGERPNIYAHSAEQTTMLHQETGVLPFSVLQPILAKIKNLKISPALHNEGTGRDGQIIELSIGEAENWSQAAFSWWTCVTPDTWEPLEEIAFLLEETALRLQAREAAFWRIGTTVEQEAESYKILQICEKVQSQDS